MRIRPWLAAFVVLASAPTFARAAPTAEDSARAEELFRAAKALMAQGQAIDACPKLAESYRIDPGGGTLLTLALCKEAIGHTASAWTDFNDAAAMAKHDARTDRETIARAHADALAPRLRRLRIAAPPAVVPDLVVTRDGVLIGPPAWNVAAPVDPGEHVIEVSAPGYAPVRIVVDSPAEGETRDVELPPLAPLEAEPTNEAAPAPTFVPPVVPEIRGNAGTSATRWASYAAIAVGLVGVGAGIFLGVDARNKRDDANARCPAVDCSDAYAVDESRRAGTRADWSTASFAIGGVALAAGAVLFVVSRGR